MMASVGAVLFFRITQSIFEYCVDRKVVACLKYLFN